MPLSPLVAPVAALGERERVRTARHRSLAALGDEGQRRLAAAHVAIVGVGGLGSPAILALAAAGVGTLTLIDDDVVELANLQRQILHRLADVGRSKTASAARAASDLSETRVREIRERLTPANATRLLADADVIVDGSDTFVTREAVAAAAVELGVPLVWGAVQETHGQVTVFWSAPPAGWPAIHLADLYPAGSGAEAPACADVGVLGPLCLQVGAMLATEVVKLVAGVGEPLLGRVLVVDALDARQREVTLRPAPDRPAKATAPVPQLTADELRAAVAGGARLLDVREPHETARGVVAGSQLMPLADVLADPGSIGGPVVVVCQVGVRATRAAEALRDAGVPATVLAGGIEAWQRSGGPVAVPA